MSSQYLPPSSQSIEHCPRCGSESYAELNVDLSYGGRLPQGKQCFECRYPFWNASGEVVRGARPSVQADTVSLKVRQMGNPRAGSWKGAATYDAAPLVV